MSETLELAPALAQEWQAAGYQQATAIQKLHGTFSARPISGGYFAYGEW